MPPIFCPAMLVPLLLPSDAIQQHVKSIFALIVRAALPLMHLSSKCLKLYVVWSFAMRC